jgi:hypothetical protein
MKSINEFELGATAKELLTGFQGLVVGKTIHLNGCHRVVIQPTTLVKGEPHKSLAVDVQQLDIITDIPVVKSGNIGLDWGNVKLGVRVRDLVTSYSGVVVSKTEWFGGKKRVAVMSQELVEGQPLPIHEFDVTQIEVLDPKPIFGDIEAKLGGPGGPYPDPTP